MFSVLVLSCLWLWETARPVFGFKEGRWLHAGRNLVIAVCNLVILSLTFSVAIVSVANWTQAKGWGVLNLAEVNQGIRLALAVLLLDAWMYVWHRANHVIPFLWRFHRMHHSDPHMDVTTATRFHLGEQIYSATLRLGLIPLLGLQVWHLVLYDTLVISVIQFHHADISLGRFDRWLRLIVVTPDIHKIHHSRVLHETNSNYSTVFSWWDRLALSFQMRPNPATVQFGLPDYDNPRWQTLTGMWKTPFSDPNQP